MPIKGLHQQRYLGYSRSSSIAFFRSAMYAAEQCVELSGYYSFPDKSCYYNRSTDGSLCRYFVNLKCYPHVDSSYTVSTCANVGGYFTTYNAQGAAGRFCYYRQFNCTFHSANGQCYRFKTLVRSRSECDANDGYYTHGYCYYECPDSKYLINDRCYDFRSARYTQEDCEAVGGRYTHDHCFIDSCRYWSLNNHCYRNRSASYSSGTCKNIGGNYAAETVPPYCYYTSFACRHHTVDGQCYSRSSNQSQAACDTIPDSYYDVGNSTCYYYCVEMPKLGDCIVGANSSFTSETCKLIGGIYSNRTCYYITLYCPTYKANGQCYSNRSVSLTCDTCRNIGGHYENGWCHYYENNCSGYSMHEQCYSSRTFTYSNSSCHDVGGLFRHGYCYHEETECRNSHYRNCTCFRNRTPSTSPATCANIGGYYDFKIRQCFYNSSTCRYYSRNNQCYRQKGLDFSRQTCSNIAGYYIRESQSGRYRYACYFNEFNCSNWECYARFSSSYNKGTCISVGGYYSHDHQGCHYNSFSCRYQGQGQCYDKSFDRWSKQQCDEARGYYVSSYGLCYISDYYCPHVVSSYRKCFSYSSPTYVCHSCRLLGGLLYSGRCYYNRNCSESLFPASNGQCYESRTWVRTADECSSVLGEAFHDDDGSLCYFTSASSCSSGHYVNCQCYTHQSTVFTADSCNNFGGYYTNDICYYNSSHCPNTYHSINGQCYRQSDQYSPSTCLNIGGYYAYPSAPDTVSDATITGNPVPVGTCYYNSFDCSGFIVDQRLCYTNRSATYSRATCRNIGGIYGFQDDGRHYHSAGSEMRSTRHPYYCLYDTFNCSG